MGLPVGDWDEIRRPWLNRVFFMAGFVVAPFRAAWLREARRGRPGASRGAPCLLPFPSVVRSPQGVDFVPLLWAEFEQLACFFFEDDDSDDDDGDNSGDDDLLRGPASLTEELRSARVSLPRVRRAFPLLFWKRSSFTLLLLLRHSDNDEDDDGDGDDVFEEGGGGGGVASKRTLLLAQECPSCCFLLLVVCY